MALSIAGQKFNSEQAGEIITRSNSSALDEVLGDEDQLLNWFTKGNIKDADKHFEDAKKTLAVSQYATAFVISDKSADRDGDTIDQNGLDPTEWTKNPVIMFGHDHSIPVIGKGMAIHTDGEKTKALGFFISKEINPFAGMIGEMYRHGFMRAVSIGFRAKKWSPIEDGGYHFTKSELVEFSAVNVGSNRNALAEAKAFGVDISPAKRELEKLLDESSIILPRNELEAWWKTVSPSTTFSLEKLREKTMKKIDWKSAFLQLSKNLPVADVVAAIESNEEIATMPTSEPEVTPEPEKTTTVDEPETHQPALEEPETKAFDVDAFAKAFREKIL